MRIYTLLFSLCLIVATLKTALGADPAKPVVITLSPSRTEWGPFDQSMVDKRQKSSDVTEGLDSASKGEAPDSKGRVAFVLSNGVKCYSCHAEDENKSKADVITLGYVGTGKGKVTEKVTNPRYRRDVFVQKETADQLVLKLSEPWEKIKWVKVGDADIPRKRVLLQSGNSVTLDLRNYDIPLGDFEVFYVSSKPCPKENEQQKAFNLVIVNEGSRLDSKGEELIKKLAPPKVPDLNSRP